MVDFISGLIVLAIFLAFVTPWIRAIAGRYRGPVTGRPMPGGPRDLAESGGYQRYPPIRKEPATPSPAAGRSREQEAQLLVSRSAAAPTDAGSMPFETRNARSLRRALATPASLRTAVLIKEVMDSPVSMKEHGR